MWALVEGVCLFRSLIGAVKVIPRHPFIVSADCASRAIPLVLIFWKVCLRKLAHLKVLSRISTDYGFLERRGFRVVLACSDYINTNLMCIFIAYVSEIRAMGSEK